MSNSHLNLNHLQPIIRVRNLHRIFTVDGKDVHAVHGVSLDVPRGVMSMISGHTGAGKTTLLNLISGLDEATSGEVWIEDRNLFALSEHERIALRRERIGFIFQRPGLLPLLSTAENVSIPLRLLRINSKVRNARVAEALEWVGLASHTSLRPYELNHEEQQRVAIARAIIAQPAIIIADEPTGHLDSEDAKQIRTIMQRLLSDHDITMVVATNDPQIIELAQARFELHDGRLVTVERQSQALGI